MVELYSPDAIRQQSGFDLMREMESLEPDQNAPNSQTKEQLIEQLWEAVMQLLKSDHTRGFRVDVETDSTIEMDAGQTQEARTEFLTSSGNFLNNILPVMQTVPDLIPVAGEMLLFTVRGYRAGRTLESAFEEAVQSMNQKLEQQKQAEQQQAEQGPPPDPAAEAEAQKIQQQMQIEGQKGQAQIQSLQQKGQIEAQKGEAEAQKGQLELAQAQAELQHMFQKQALELEKIKAQVEAVGQTVQ